MYYLGIDIGSLSCDAVVIDDDGRIVSSSVVPTGARNIEAIARARAEATRAAGIEHGALKAVVATGYGRDRVDDRLASVTEITCHARGIGKLLPGTRLLIDIGGQDSKAILLDRDGLVVEFAMNDKCAAGTGRFLEAMARALEVDIDRLGALGRGAKGGVTLSSMCTVFAESEVVSLIADGAEVREIVAALHRAIAARTVTLVRRVTSDVSGLRVAMSGGVARNSGVVDALKEALGCNVDVPPEPDIVGALGAALFAKDRAGNG
ncbi:MAG: 2-hydroxyglutaryl-CoA dehydratase [Deltaproteobacteria bacterium]|nr:2-hydroxyglutaryl-CoA dehydratase [Deltaproteobacteria bacterium]